MTISDVGLRACHREFWLPCAAGTKGPTTKAQGAGKLVFLSRQVVVFDPQEEAYCILRSPILTQLRPTYPKTNEALLM